MKVLVVHNRYNLRGGEESVFEAEVRLLEEGGIRTRTLEFTNAGFASGWRRIAAPFLSFFNPASFFHARRAIDDFRPDLVHVHNIFSVATAAVIYAAKSKGVPVVMTLHNFRLLCPSATLLHDGRIFEDSLRSWFPWSAVRSSVYRNSFVQTLALALNITVHRMIGTWRRVDRFIVLSRFAKSVFLRGRLGIPESRLAVKPNFTSDRGCSSEKTGDYLFVGRLSPEKGLPVVLEAFRNTSHGLTIVGDGPLREDVEQAARESNIRYLGPLPPDQVLQTMKSAKALVFPSIWYEGMPMVILESFSVGTPVVASNLGTMAEIIVPGANGEHFEPGDPMALRKVIEKLESSPRTATALGEGARESWRNLYAPQGNFQRLTEIYREVLEQRSATR